MSEMKNFGEQPTEKEVNDIKGVIIEREALVVTINRQKYYIDIDKMRIVEANNPEEIAEM